MRVVLSTLVVAAVAVCVASGTPAQRLACKANNGIGPDGGLAALPPPTAAGARFVDLLQNAAPVDMAIDRSTGRVFVVQRGTNDVAVVNGKADPAQLLSTVRVGARPEAVEFDPRSKRLFVANGAACSVSVLDVRGPTPRLLATLPAASGPRKLALDPKTGLVYTANFTGNTIRVINGRAARPALLPSPLVVGPDHVAVAFEPKSRKLVMVTSQGQLQIFSLARGKAAAAGLVPVDSPIDTTSDGRGFVYVVNLAPGTVTKVDVVKRAKVKTSPAVGSNPFTITCDPGSNRLVLPTRSGAVALVNPQTLALAGTVPSSPALTAAAVDPGTCRLWMLDYTYHRVWSVPYKGRCA